MSKPRTHSRSARPPCPTHRRQQGAARLSLFSNLFLVGLKIGVGVASGAISVLAEGIQSTMDVAASAMILVTVRLAAAPPDRSHPYGHGKLENLAALVQGLLIFGTAGYLLWAAWQRWQNPVMPRVDWGAAALAVSLLVNAAVSTRVLRVARETGSPALEAEATHLRGDMLSCVGILAGLGAVAVTGEARVDPLMAAGMALVVVASATRLLDQSIRPLLDERLPQDEEQAVRAVLEQDPRVRGYHRLRTRRSGPWRLVDLHVLMDDRLSFSQAHAIAEEVEGAIRRVLPNADVIVHAEPFEEEMRHRAERPHLEPDTG